MSKSKNYVIDVYCVCRQFLFRYMKEGGGHLVKCFRSNISQDQTKKDGVCPACEQTFAKDAVIKNRPALKVVKSRVFVKGHHG